MERIHFTWPNTKFYGLDFIIEGFRRQIVDSFWDHLQVGFKFQIYIRLISKIPSIHMKRPSIGSYVVHVINSMLILLSSSNLVVKCNDEKRTEASVWNGVHDQWSGHQIIESSFQLFKKLEETVPGTKRWASQVTVIISIKDMHALSCVHPQTLTHIYNTIQYT